MRDPAAVVYPVRICIGKAHEPRCDHQTTLREGVELFLESPATRVRLASLFAAMVYPSVSPEGDAERVLSSLLEP